MHKTWHSFNVLQCFQLFTAQNFKKLTESKQKLYMHQNLLVRLIHTAVDHEKMSILDSIGLFSARKK